MAFSAKQNNTLITIYLVTSIISIIADCFIIFGYLRFRALRKLAFTFVFLIALADFCRSLAQTWGDIRGAAEFWCIFQGWLQTFGGVAMGLWFTTIAVVCISIKKSSVWWKTKTQADIQKFQLIVAVIVTVVAIICASVPIPTYGWTGGWCWISKEYDNGHIYRYAFYYGWLMAALLCTIVIYCELFRMVRMENKLMRQESAEEPSTQSAQSATSVASTSSPRAAPSTLDTKKRQKKMFDQMKLYPWALIIGQGPGAIRRIVELSTGDDIYALAVIHAICSGLFGFITAVIYGTKTWQIYHYKLTKCCNTMSAKGNENKEDPKTVKDQNATVNP